MFLDGESAVPVDTSVEDVHYRTTHFNLEEDHHA